MVIINQKNLKLYNPKPKTEQEKQYSTQHGQQLKITKENQICPGCGRKLPGNLVLINHGYKYGIECEFCR